MFLMLAEVLRSCDVAARLVTSVAWAAVCRQQTHAAWLGASLHDFIQPGFYFLVGVGLILSVRRRARFGQSARKMAKHVIIRSLVLILLGIGILSIHPRHVVFQFVDTLTQIGLAYPFLFLIAIRPRRFWVGAFVGILVGYWLLFALSPLPPPGFDYASAGVSPDWLAIHGLTGFWGHWQKNSNVAALFDRWLLNLIPGVPPYRGVDTGLTTLNFVPSIATMILGLFAGDVLRRQLRPLQIVLWVAGTAAAMLTAGLLLGWSGVCPIIKAVWTPSWVLFSGGICLLFLLVFYLLVDLAGFSRLAFPLVVIGSNSLIAYLLSHFYPAVAFNALRRLVGDAPFMVMGPAYQPLLYGCSVLAAYWTFLFILYRRRLFIKI
jgi:predicted acyltransferase